MNLTATPDTPVELARRSADGLTVSLLWYAGARRAAVRVEDALLGDCFELPIGAGDAPIDVFEHPFAFAARR
jgi:hypothetical protein